MLWIHTVTAEAEIQPIRAALRERPQVQRQSFTKEEQKP